MKGLNRLCSDGLLALVLGKACLGGRFLRELGRVPPLFFGSLPMCFGSI